MTTQTEALKRVLEKIATVNAMDYEYQTWAREALAQPEQCTGCEGKPSHTNNPCSVCGKSQPEQEPVAWRWKMSDVHPHLWEVSTKPHKMALRVEPLYTTPPQRTWVGLTDEEMEEVRKQAVDLFVQEVKTTGKGRNEPIKFGRLVEAKLKEKNT